MIDLKRNVCALFAIFGACSTPASVPAVVDAGMTTDAEAVDAGAPDAPTPSLPNELAFGFDRPAAATRGQLADLGYATMRVQGVKAEGTRPLLTVMLQFSDVTFTEKHTREYFESVMFGPSYPNIADYFAENSGGIFAWENIGVIAPVTPPDDPSTKGDEASQACQFTPSECGGTISGDQQIRKSAIDGAREAGIDFELYDVNADGFVTQDEMQLNIISAFADPGAIGGATRWADCIDAGSVQVCPGMVPEASEYAGFATRTHELMHTLGTLDLYGDTCNSFEVTLMSCTDQGTFHLDPWHKIQLGWVVPTIWDVSAAVATCAQLASKDRVDDPLLRPLVLRDRNSHDGEYFILEYRDGSNAKSYDHDVASNGLAVWHVKTAEGLALATVPGITIFPGANARIDSRVARRSDDELSRYVWGGQYITPGPDRVLQSMATGDDELSVVPANFLFGAPDANAASGNQGGSTLWTPAMGLIHLTWISGEDTNVWIQAFESDSASTMTVAVGRGDEATSDPHFVDRAGLAADCGLDL